MYMNNYSVYCHTHKITGKKYFGITKRDPDKRWKNGYGYRTQLIFYRAILKYGWGQFYHDVLYDGLSEKQAKEKEIQLIKEYKTTSTRYGYNRTQGGDNPIHSKESNAKISKAIKQLWQKENYKTMMSDKHKGKTFTEETKEKLSKAKKGKYMDSQNANSKLIICVEMEKEYFSISGAARQINVCPQAIWKAIHNKSKCKGYHWKYKDNIA